MNRSVLIRIALMLSLLILAGCNAGPDNSHATLYVDQLAVAKALGRDEVMKQLLGSAVDKLNAQLTDITQQLAGRLQAEKDKLGDKPSQQALEDYRKLSTKANQELQQTRLLARQKAQVYQQRLLLSFRQELKQAAENIARDKQADAVELIGNQTLWFTPEADITDEVIAALRAKASAPADKNATGKPVTAANGQAGNDVQQEIDKLEQLVDEIDQKDKGTSE